MPLNCLPTLLWLGLTVISTSLYAHGGGLDADGCHNNNKEGNYHCHQGNYKDRVFASQNAMHTQRQEDAERRQKASQKSPTTEDRLRELKKLHEENLITDEEYNEKREAILEEL